MVDSLSLSSENSRAATILCAALFLIALLFAIWIRFDEIEIKPFHHDEGVNSYFLRNLAAPNGSYAYNPENYHGPTLYYFALVAMKFFDETDLALRFTPAIFGVLTVLLLWPLRRHLGTIGTPVAAFCIALSPGLVYYSRDFIHEMPFGCFTLGIVVGAWRYAESKHGAWLTLMASSIGLLLATKETAIVNGAVILIAMGSAAVWSASQKLFRERRFTLPALLRELNGDAAKARPSLDHLLAALILIIFIHIFFYSSVFTHWQGVTDFFYALKHWTKERSGNDHVHPFYYYFGILIKLELPLVIGAVLGGLVVLLKGTRFWLFIAAWMMGTALAYSIIPYKTPWLIVSVLIPMAILCGYAAEQIFQLFPMMSARILWIGIILAALLFSGRMAERVNFEKYDDNSNASGYFAELGRQQNFKPYVDGQYGYVYAQTDRDFLFLIEAIKHQAEKLPTGKHTGILVASPDYWPMPWYLRDYDQVAFSGSLPGGDPPAISQPIIVAKETQRADLDRIPGWHAATQPFTLRPGVHLLLYVKDGNPIR